MTVPRAIVFDVGWTLIHPRLSLWEMMAAAAADAGANVPADQAERVVYALVKGAQERTVAAISSGARFSDSDEEFQQQLRLLCGTVFESCGVVGDHSGAFVERFSDPDNWALYPDVLPGLDRLRAAGLCVGVLTNAGSAMSEFLQRLGVAPHLDFQVISAIEGVKKPDPRVFRRALELAGTSASETVHVGDMFVEDVLGARGVGIRALLMERRTRGMFSDNPESSLHEPGAVETVGDLDEVAACVGLDWTG